MSAFFPCLIYSLLSRYLIRIFLNWIGMKHPPTLKVQCLCVRANKSSLSGGMRRQVGATRPAFASPNLVFFGNKCLVFHSFLRKIIYQPKASNQGR